MKHRMRILALAALGLFSFLLLVGSRGVTTDHEGRVGVVARAMAESGWPWNARPIATPLYIEKDVAYTHPGLLPTDKTIQVNPWGVPLFNGQIRLQKPPLPYWCAAVLFRLIGRSELSLRLVPALLGALATLLLFDFTRQLLGRRLAWFAALAWVSSYFVVGEYRKAMADPYLAFFTLLCLWAWVRACCGAGFQSASVGKPQAENLRHNLSWIVLFYVAMALAWLAKGPPIWVHLAVAIGLFHLCFRSTLPRPIWAHLLGFGLFLAIALPWPIYILHRVPNAAEIWRYESIGELTDNVRNAEPWYFYLPQVFLLAMPWIGLWALGLAAPLLRAWRLQSTQAAKGSIENSPQWVERHSGATRASLLAHATQSMARLLINRRTFAALWYGITLLFFSCVNLKKNAYLLPMMPAEAILIAQGAVLLIAWTRRAPRASGLPRLIGGSQGLLGLGFSLWLVFQLIGGKFHPALPLGLALSAAALAAGVIPLLPRVQDRLARWFVIQAIAYAVLLSLLYNAYQAPKARQSSPKRMAEQIAQAAQSSGATLYRDLEADALFYLPETFPPYDPAAATILVPLKRNDAGAEPNTEFFAYVGARSPIIAIRRVADLKRDGLWLYELQTAEEATTTAPSPP